jgi:UDP-N-acetylglucosamine--N-acetylmuramyl-(pentapeptide) pyrophosphoryl-undecaprenol N-acetylglucosamine transferase
MRVVLAGGGTAGHVNPAIAVARALTGDDVSFVGTDRGVEASLVPEAGYELDNIRVVGFDRARPLSFPATAARAVGAIRGARRILKAARPDVVVGMGGYVSLPVSLAARSVGVPVVLHEQNIVLGLAHKVCKPFAARVGVSFDETLAEVGRKGVVVGNPVVPEIAIADRDSERKRGLERFELDPARRTLLVFGGSLGAQTINQGTVELARVWSDRSDIQIVHILGRRHQPLDAAREGSLIYRALPYVDRMIEAYAVADLALCRGGATTIAELTVSGVPSVIVPYPHHRDRQQERQGNVLARAGAAVLIPDGEVDAARLATECGDLLSDGDRLDAMRTSALGLGRPEAAERMAAVVRAAGGGSS